MPSLRTALGNALFGNDDIVLIHVEKGTDRELGLSADYARHVTNGYVVANALENPIRFLIDTIAKDAYENAWLHVEEIKEWNEGQRKKLAEYDEVQAKKRKSIEENPLGLVLNGLKASGMPVRGIISAYERQHCILHPNQKTTVLKLLGVHGYSDPDFLAGMEIILDGGGVVDEGIWKTLTEELNVTVPPKDPPPAVEIKQEHPLLQELEAVVSKAYSGQGLEGIALTQQAWVEAGINPEEIYTAVNADVRQLNDQHILVKVDGQSEDNSGGLDLVLLDTDPRLTLKKRVPQPLRRYFERPTEIADRAHGLLLALNRMIDTYLSDDEKSSNLLKSLTSPYLKRTLFGRVIGKERFLERLFPDVYGVSVSEEEVRRHELVADKVDAAIKDNKVSYKVADMIVPIGDLTGVVRYLFTLFPDEMYELRGVDGLIGWANRKILESRKEEAKGKTLTPEGVKYFDGVYKLRDDLKRERPRLVQKLGILAEGSGEWGYNFNTSKLFYEVHLT